MRVICAALFAALLFSPIVARAEIAVSANDGKQVQAGDSGPTPDSVSVLDIGGGRARVLGSIAVPAAMIGPPTSVAIAHHGGFAIVAASQALEGGKLVPNDAVSVIDLAQPSRPRLIQSLHAGMGAGGVSINPADSLALMVNRDENSVSIFAISAKTLTAIGKLQLDAASEPTDVVFAPDGKSAFVVAQRSSKLIVLAVDGTKVTNTGRTMVPGRMPYGAVVTRDGRYIITTNLRGAMEATPANSQAGTISMINLSTGMETASVEVGPTPEHVALSADGKYAAVVVANGAATLRSDPKYDSVLGLLKIYAVGNGTLSPVASADTCHWSQGATFSKDNSTVLLQCAAEREIQVFRFDGARLSQDKSATIVLQSRPGAIVTAWGH
jgi:DNA-binding beta-propeller fold protein YncE